MVLIVAPEKPYDTSVSEALENMDALASIDDANIVAHLSLELLNFLAPFNRPAVQLHQKHHRPKIAVGAVLEPLA